MSVSSTTTKVSYSGDGSQTVFAYTFKIFAAADLRVIERASNGTETVKTLTTDYTVSGAGTESGGNVTFTTAPASGVTVVIKRNLGLTQGTDYIENDPFPAESHEDALDRLTFIAQNIQEQVDRCIKASETNTLSGAEFTVDATDRANKIFAFDADGDVNITQEIGTFRGSDTTTTTAAYNVRDLVKSTSTAQLNNIYICTATAAVGDLLTDTDHFELLVDAYSAATSATNAAASATTATTKASEAATSATAAETAKTASETAKTASEAAKTAAEAAQTAAETAQTAAETALDTFDDRFLGAKSTDPTVDNDGNALIDGALYFDTTNDIMKVYDLTNTQWRQLTLTSSNQTNVNTVAGQISPTNNVSTVAGVASDISTVAGISANVTTVAGISANTTTVAGISSNVSTVAGVSSDVTTVAGISSDVSAVEDIASDVTSVAGIAANVTTVAGVSSDVTTVAGISANVTTVATNDSNITTVASNITGVNSFSERYRVSASAPASSLDSGDLWFDTTNNVMKVYGSGGFINAGSSVNGTTNRQDYVVGTASGTYTGSTTDFPATYDAGFVDVYLNGIKLQPADFTATSGTNVVLASAAQTSDTVSIVGYGTFQLSNFSVGDANDVDLTGLANNQFLQYNSTSTNFEPTAITQATGNELENLSEDTSPSLGGNLDLNSNNITGTGDITITGTLNASADVQINGASVATTGKAIAMAMVFGG